MNTKVSGSIWLVLTQRGTIFATGENEVRATIAAIDRDNVSPFEEAPFIEQWQSLVNKGYTCVEIKIEETFSIDDLTHHNAKVLHKLTNTQTYDP